MAKLVNRLDRQCLKDSQLGLYQIKKDTLIQIPIWAVHHSPEFYDDPMTFDPERFLGDEGKKRRNELSYLAFGGGPRVCIGMR